MNKKLLLLALTIPFLGGCALQSKPAKVPRQQAPVVSTSASIPENPVSVGADKGVLYDPNFKQIEGLKLFSYYNDASNTNNYHFEDQTEYFSDGTFSYKGGIAELIFVAAGGVDMGVNTDYYFFARTSSSLVLLAKESFKLSEINAAYGDGFDRTKFEIDNETELPMLHVAKTLTIGPRKTLYLEDTLHIGYQYPGLEKSFVDPKIGQVYFSTTTNAYAVKFGPLLALYSVRVDFYDKYNLVPQITWNDGTKNTQEYAYATMSGCGHANFEAVVPEGKIDIAKDLEPVGKNNKGDAIYALKDSNHSLLKDLYENSYFVPEGQTKLSYADFLRYRPYLYWIDPFGKLVQLQNKKFAPMAECGKPVIYLYPRETTTATVWLQPQGGFTYSEPQYVVNWLVKAQPNGHLTDLRSNKEYPYLFWEGRGAFYEQPKKGFVVKRQNLKGFLTEKLTLLGLNRIERTDFMDYWLPKMQEKPYYFVTFMGNETMDELAPLTIEPKPDTVIRILMDYKPLDKPISVTGFKIRKPVRRGFTVVEWGGVLR